MQQLSIRINELSIQIKQKYNNVQIHLKEMPMTIWEILLNFLEWHKKYFLKKKRLLSSLMGKIL